MRLYQGVGLFSQANSDRMKGHGLMLLREIPPGTSGGIFSQKVLVNFEIGSRGKTESLLLKVYKDHLDMALSTVVELSWL